MTDERSLPIRSGSRGGKAGGALRAGGEAQPIFIHSSFRTSSTWLWKHFRADAAFRAYYETFHERLATLSLQDVMELTRHQWRSRHPAAAPYFIEYMPLVQPQGGVRGYAAEARLASNFFPGDRHLAVGEEAYVAGLIESARQAGKIPVLTCTRTLGRAAALRNSFGGVHILLHRNLFHQWNSFSGQHRSGNPYFFDSLFTIIDRSAHEPFMSFLSAFFRADTAADHIAMIERRYDDAFAVFVAWHIYMTIGTARVADLIVDATRIAEDEGYRRAVEQQFREATGRPFDLSDAAIQLDAPWRPIADVETAGLIVRMLVDRAYEILSVSQEERLFGEAMLDAMWGEHRRFTTYSRSYATEVASQAERILALAAPVPAIDQTDHVARQQQVEELDRQLAAAAEQIEAALAERLAATEARDEALRSGHSSYLAMNDALAEAAAATLARDEAAAAAEAAILERDAATARADAADLARDAASAAATLARDDALAAVAAADLSRDEAAAAAKAANDALAAAGEQARADTLALGEAAEREESLAGEIEAGRAALAKREAEIAALSGELAAAREALDTAQVALTRAEEDYAGRAAADRAAHRTAAASIAEGEARLADTTGELKAARELAEATALELREAGEREAGLLRRIEEGRVALIARDAELAAIAEDLARTRGALQRAEHTIGRAAERESAARTVMAVSEARLRDSVRDAEELRREVAYARRTQDVALDEAREVRRVAAYAGRATAIALSEGLMARDKLAAVIEGLPRQVH